MAEEDDRTARYEDVWNRVKKYIPFLQELISYYKNDSHQNREQQLQKIITIYDLLTNQRLNFQSLCKCESVLIKLYKTNPLQKKNTPSVPIEGSTAKSTDELDTPASPSEPEVQHESEPHDQEAANTSDEPPGLTSDTSAESSNETEIRNVPERSASLSKPIATSAASDTPAKPDTPDEPDTPAEPDDPVDSIAHLEPLSPDTDTEYWDDPPPRTRKTNVSKPPLSLDEIQRLITNKSVDTSNSRPSNNNLSKVINDTLKVLSRDFQRSSITENDRNLSPPFDVPFNVSNRNVPYSPTYQPQNSPNHSFSGNPWDAGSDGFGSFPHPVNSSFRNFPSRNSSNIEPNNRTHSPPLYRRRDDMHPQMDHHSLGDRMDISPTYSSPSDGRLVSGSMSAPSIKDPRLRKAVESNMLHNFPEAGGAMGLSPPFPMIKPNDPRFSRSSAIPPPPPNELPKCIAPNPNLPLEFPKKDPPKRRLSICAKQVIIEEIPPDPVLPPRAFPHRRQSICQDFNSNRNDEPFHGTSFLPAPPPPSHPMVHPPPPATVPPPLMSQIIPPPVPSPTSHMHTSHSIDPNIVERDPRRKHMPPAGEFLRPHQLPPQHLSQPSHLPQSPHMPQPSHVSQPQHLPQQPHLPQPPHMVQPLHHHNHFPNRPYDRPLSGPSKAPLTYLEYRRQKEINEKNKRELSKQSNREDEKESDVGEKSTPQKEQKPSHGKDKKSSEESDIMIGMVPNKSRVSAKAYAKPVKSFTPKERHFSASVKEKSRTDHKSSSKTHKSDSSTATQQSDKKRDEPEKDKIKAVPKAKDLFGEQLSQFDKMYRSGDFSKKSTPSSGIGGFKIPKIKRVEKSDPPSKSIETPPKGENSKKQSKSKLPEPPKTIVDDDDMWDSASIQGSAGKKLETTELSKDNHTKASSKLQSLEDDDLWDAESSFTANESVFDISTQTAVVSEEDSKPKEVSKDKIKDDASKGKSKDSSEDSLKESFDEKPKVEFQVPSLPAPRRILRRRNSVAVHNNDSEKCNISNAPVSLLPPRITRRRNSIAVSQLGEDVSKKEKVEKEPSQPAKTVEKSKTENKEEQEGVVRRRTRKRKAVIDDDDEDEEENCITDAASEESQKPEALEVSSNDSKEETTSQLATTAGYNSDNVVSSTTTDTTTKKRKRRKKKELTAASTEQDTSNDSTHNQKDNCSYTSANVKNDTATDEKNVDPREDQASQSTKEMKEEKENKDMVEGLMKISDNKAQLLAMLSKMLDEKKLKKIQEIIDSPNDKLPDEKPSDSAKSDDAEDVAESSRERTVSTSISSTNEVVERKKPVQKGKKSELDKLNADIAEMYIRDGVLNATGRRSCTKRPEAAVRPTKPARKSSPNASAVSVKSVKAKKTKATPAVKQEPVIKDFKKGMEFALTEKDHMKPLKIVLQKIDMSKIEVLSIRKRKMNGAEDDVASVASSGVTISPKSKKKKRSVWATGITQRRKKKADQKVIPVSPMKSYAAKPLTKNVSRELNCKSDKSKNCALCSYSGSLTGIVQHYVRYHPLHEVYVSRIPNIVANKVKKEPMAVTGTMKDQNITFKCVFCQEMLSKKKYNWKLHLASHTGEYRYKCSNCTIKSLAPSTNAHDSECTGPAMEVINDVMFEENHMYGYMCRLCNYIQLSKTKLEMHLREEHGRNITGKGTLRFSILNYNEADEAKSQETLESDISMPELTPQATVTSQTDMSAFISSASDEIESLKVLNDRNFVSPSKPSIIDKLKKNIDEQNRKDAEKAAKEDDDDGWEEIVTPPKTTETRMVTPKRVEKVKRSLTGTAAPSDDIPMPAPLAMKDEKIDVFEHKQTVSNVGFSKIGDKTWYLCLIGDCKFTTEARSEMYSHVDELHGSIMWDGYCYLCTAQVSTEETSVLAKEVKHMAVIHIKDRTAFDELNEPDMASTALKALEDETSKLKLRRFSGDKLSIGTVEAPINLKPWLEKATTKNRAHCLNMLEPKSLFCFFKCMATNCCFTTTMEVSMEKHIDNHELVGDVTGSSIKSWLECAYCEVVGEDRNDLMRHLRIVHSTSAYQCAYCFYRSREAYNTLLHQKLHHAKEKSQVLLNEADKRPLTSADYEQLNLRPIENILPLICTVCNEEYCVLDAFMAHLKDAHQDVTTIVCQCCKENIPKLKIPRHLLLHNIGIYECIYCHFGSNTMDAVQSHVCNRHPQEPMYCCIRYNKTPGKVKEASLKSLFESAVDESVIVNCKFTVEELNYKSTDTKSNHDMNFTEKTGVIPLQLPPIRIGGANILLSAQIPSEASTVVTPNNSVVVTAKTAEVIKIPMISSVSGGVSLPGAPSVPIITAVHGNYQEPSTQSTQPPAPMVMPVISQVVGAASVQPISMPIITRVEGGVGESATLKPASSLVGTKIIISPNKGGTGVPIITNVCSIGPLTNQVQAPKEDEAVMLEAERVAMEMIKDTGLPKNVIYKCVFKGCNAVLPDGIGMRKHLTFSHLPSTQYICSHCKGKPAFLNIMNFTQHLKTHEAQRIFCFMCDYKGSFPPEVIKHVRDVHKTTKPTILFLNPKKNDPNNDIILFAPGIPTDAERKAYYKKLIDLYNHKLEAALIHLKTHFAPEECESLPKQAIFSQTVCCSKCQYSTKVRLNMYRHLKGHLNDMPVSNMDPKNPVPCWGQGEKHFDRMRNPAASSQEDDDLIQSLCFVQENKRFICGAPDCRYLTINETMLRNHLSTLHADVKEYKCPHCPAVHIFSAQLNVAKVLEHLKLHDKELYRCSKCSIFMNKKNEIEQHVDDKHPSQNAAVYVIRDGSTAGSASTIGTSEDGIVFKWKCDICKFKSPALGEMKLHMQEIHNISSKYRCSMCLYSCSNKSAFTTHFESQHPGSEIVIISLYKAIEGDDSRADTTPLWRRETSKTRTIRGILLEDEVEDEDELLPPEMMTMAVESLPGPSGLNSITRKRRSTETNESEASPKRVKEDNPNSAIRAFKCGYRGCNYVNDFGAGIVTHFRTAHPSEKPSVLRNALANPEQSRFDYFLKYACFYCVKKSDTINDLLAHWRQMHKIAGRRSQDKPFLFRTAKIILCFYCRKGAVMPEMKSHFSSNHPGQQPIYLDFRNPKRCAECDFTMGTDKLDMVTHFMQEHKKENEYAKGWIDFLTDEVVDKILQLNNMVYRCEKCDFYTDNKTDFTIHYATKHPGMRVEFNEYEMEKNILYYCAFSNCKSSHKSPQELAQHIQYHIPLFKCQCNATQCPAEFRSFVMLLQHFNTTHPQHDLHYALKTPDEYKAVLRSINIQFWNGFVMTLDDARRAGNRYGSYDYFFKYIDELCAKSVAAALPSS